MTEDHFEEELITDKHLQLSRWAQIANILAWVSLTTGIILTIAFFPTELAKEEEFRQITGYFPSPKTYLDEIVFVLNAVSIFLKGLLSTFAFKAVSLGLYMLIEIDLNYKLSKEE